MESTQKIHSSHFVPAVRTLAFLGRGSERAASDTAGCQASLGLGFLGKLGWELGQKAREPPAKAPQ